MTNIFKELKNSKGIFDDLDKNTLRSVIKSFNNTSMSVDDLAQKFGGLNTETITYLKSAKRGEASLEGLSASMTSASISTKLLSVALNALSGLAISLIIKGFTWALDELIVTLDEQKQKLDEAVTAYEESKSELEQINDELKTTGERIDELNDKENLTFTEQDELEKLIKTNDELERKIYLLEQANKEAEKEVATEAQNTYDKYTNDRTIGAVEQIDFYADSSLLEGVSWNNFKGDLSWLVAQYKNQQEILTNAQANGWTQIEEQTKSNLELLEGYMSDASLNYQDLYDKISGISDYAMTDELKVAKQDLDDILDIVAEILGYGGQRSETSFDNIWNSEDFSQYKTELETLAKEGKLDASVLESNENYKKLLEDTGTTAEDTAQHINALVDEIGKTGQEANKIDVSSILSGVQSLSDGLDQLDKIYADVKDGEYFDFSSILNNKEFTEAFGNLGESYENFIETITNSPSDIKACQSAFNDLATAYINNSGALANVTEETKNSTIAMLKQMGVANAEEIVINQLKAKTLAQSDVFKDLTSATLENTDELYNNVQQLIAEADASGITISAMADLVAQQQIFNNQDLDVNSKIQSLAKLASAFGAVADAANISAHQQYMATEISMAYRNGASASDIESIKNGYLKSASSTFQNAISAKFGSLSSKINYTGGSKTNGGSSKSQSEKEFNWIETLLSRIQNKISDLGKTASATWKSWTERNSALKDQMSAVSQEISLQQQAISKYESLAGSLGLSSHYQNLVKNGALDISTITDDNLADKISKYQEYWEKIVSAEDAIVDLQDELRQLEQTDFDNIITQYEDQLAFIEHDMSVLESTADLLENKGYMASASIYDSLIQQESAKISSLEAQYKALTNELASNGIQQGTEQWNEMKLEILEVEEAILESKNALVEYNNTLQELDWEVFDKLQEKISGITEEADFLIKLMSDEKMFDEGKITEHGQATLGLYALNYKTYLAQAEQYSQKLEEIREDLENDPYNQTLVEQEKKWTEALRDSILASEDALQSIVDLKQEGYDSLLESLDTAIEKYKDLINEQKNAYDYQKQIDNLTGDVTKYQKIMKSLEGMGDTEEGKKLIQEYSVKLQDSEEALVEAENEKYLDDLDKLLQNLSDDATEFVSQKMDNVDVLIGEVIAQTETNTGSILETLKTETSNVNTTITSEMEKVWGTNGTFTTSLNSVVDMFKQYFDNLQKEADEKAKQTIASTPSGSSSSGSTTTATPTSTPAPSTSSSSSSSSSSSWGSWFVSKTYSKQNLNPETSIVDRLKSKNINADFSYRSQYYRSMGGSGLYTGSASQNRWMLTQMKSHGFTQGGTIGNLIKATGEDGFVLARTGEGILTPENMKMLENVMMTMNPIVNSLAKLPSLPDVQSRYGGNTSVGDVSVTFDLPNVKNYSEFMTQMQNDPKFEGMILHMAFGKNSMDKYKYKWN